MTNPHQPGPLPEAQAAVQRTGDEYGDTAVTANPWPAGHAWRAGSVRGSAGPTTEATTPELARVHLSDGRPDPRHTEAGAYGNPNAPVRENGAELRRNMRGPVVERGVTDLTRSRAGFTSADPARTARFQFATLLRPFDKWAGDSTTAAVDKIGQPNPTAARPPERRRLLGGLPSPAGSTGSEHEPTGAQPNTMRVMPNPWDALLVTTGAPAAGTVDEAGAAIAGRRGSGWRA